ncbi:tyrosine-type recombinase/integrase [Kaistia hirudinis]|nr:site-specific integrase [Kaistia hirudinis]
MTVGNLLDRYEQTITCTKRSGDRERYKLAVLRRHALARTKLSKVTSASVAAYRNERLTQVKTGTVRRELALLSHCFEVARNEWGVPLGRNPLAGVKKPPAGRARQRRLELSDIEAINDAIGHSPPYLRPLVEIAIETGMRRGELLALRWDHVDFERGVARLPITKNGDRRDVPLSSRAKCILRQLDRSASYVFPIKAGTVGRAWERMTRRAALSDLRFHNLRHEAISRFFEQGLSVPEVALISGHKDLRMLFRYTHIRPEEVSKKLL